MTRVAQSLFLLSFLLGAQAVSAQAPVWIWHGQEQGENLFARKKFHVHNRVHSAELRICADDGATIYLNGREILPAITGRKPQTKNVTSQLRLGRNVLAAKVDNKTGKRGFIAMLVITLSTGKRILIKSDYSWKASPGNSSGWYQLDFNDSRWQEAKMLAPHGAEPWGPVLNR